MAADAAAAVCTEVLKELVGEVDAARRAECGGEARGVGEGQAVGQLLELAQLRESPGPVLSQQIDRHHGGDQQSQTDTCCAFSHGPPLLYDRQLSWGEGHALCSLPPAACGIFTSC